MNFKPFRDYSEHDVLNLFKLQDATGSKATPVVIANSGANTNNGTPRVALNLASAISVNVYSPRWDIYPAVRRAVSGEKPLGLTLYDTREVNFLGYPLIYDQVRARELQCVTSGQAVPIVRKGLFSVGPFQSGEVPAPGKYLAVRGTGELGVSATATGVSGVGLPVFGEFLGNKDNDGYAYVHINCYL